MQVQVETYAGDSGIELPTRFHLDGRSIEVIDNIDRWFGPDYCYFKVKDAGGNLYILRLDEPRNEWELTMFRSARAEGLPLPRQRGGPATA